MTPEQAERLTDEHYVASLNISRPVGYKVTRVRHDTTVTLIQVNSLYSDEWVLASAFFIVSGVLPTKTEVERFHEARRAALGVPA